MAAVFVVVAVDWTIKRCKRVESVRSANRSLCHTVFSPPLLMYSLSKINTLYLGLSGKKPVQMEGTTNVSPAKLCGEAQTKRGTGRAADCRYRCISVQHPVQMHENYHAESRSAFVPKPDTTNVHSHPTRFHQLRRTYNRIRKAFRSCELGS